MFYFCTVCGSSLYEILVEKLSLGNTSYPILEPQFVPGLFLHVFSLTSDFDKPCPWPRTLERVASNPNSRDATPWPRARRWTRMDADVLQRWTRMLRMDSRADCCIHTTWTECFAELSVTMLHSVAFRHISVETTGLPRSVAAMTIVGLQTVSSRSKPISSRIFIELDELSR